MQTLCQKRFGREENIMFASHFGCVFEKITWRFPLILVSRLQPRRISTGQVDLSSHASVSLIESSRDYSCQKCRPLPIPIWSPHSDHPYSTLFHTHHEKHFALCQCVSKLEKSYDEFPTPRSCSDGVLTPDRFTCGQSCLVTWHQTWQGRRWINRGKPTKYYVCYVILNEVGVGEIFFQSTSIQKIKKFVWKRGVLVLCFCNELYSVYADEVCCVVHHKTRPVTNIAQLWYRPHIIPGETISSHQVAFLISIYIYIADVAVAVSDY